MITIHAVYKKLVVSNGNLVYIFKVENESPEKQRKKVEYL